MFSGPSAAGVDRHVFFLGKLLHGHRCGEGFLLDFPAVPEANITRCLAYFGSSLVAFKNERPS